MKTNITVHFVARSHSIICKSYIQSVCLVFFFLLIKRIDNGKTNLLNNCVRESLQKIVKFFSFILCLIILMISVHSAVRIPILRLPDFHHVPL